MVKPPFLLMVCAIALTGCGQKTTVRSPSEPGGVTAIVNVNTPLAASCVRNEEILVRVNGGQVAVLPPGSTDLKFQFIAVLATNNSMELTLRNGAVLYSGPLNVKLVAEGFVNFGSLAFECRATGS